ncbi:MAG TPA: enoyl-CoA hydratase-related protein [Candidatus Binataceae bacterium]|nr:enoyl-CoA hydratase-related protein [Candidatus Binataceae bacterium]
MPESEYSTLLFDVRDNLAYVTLNRPDAANALNAEMAHDLMEVALRCEEDPTVRAVLLGATGKIFCAGGDLKSFAAQPKAMLPTYLKKVTFHLHKAISRLNRMKAPVVLAIQGAAGGAGMSLACAGDIVIAAESARFTMAYTRAGLTPDGSSTYFLPRIVGLRRAMELSLTNRLLSAREASEMGIVTRVVPDAELTTNAEALAKGFAQGPTRAYLGVKRLLAASATNTLEDQMELETEWIADMGRTSDGREGIASFLEKRPPKFKGE